MSKILLGTLIVWLVTSCAPEVTEEPSSSVLVNTNSGITIPEGVTVHDADLNSDGTINMDDLVIVGKFFGQDVPETGDLAMASDTGDLAMASDTGTYSYVLVDMVQYDYLSEYRAILNRDGGDLPEEYSYYEKELINNELAYLRQTAPYSSPFISVKFALRFLIEKADDTPVIEIKVKPVGENHFLKKPITQSLAMFRFQSGFYTYLPETTIDGGGKWKMYIAIRDGRLQTPYDPYLEIEKKDGHITKIPQIMIAVPRSVHSEVYTYEKNVAENWFSYEQGKRFGFTGRKYSFTSLDADTGKTIYRRGEPFGVRFDDGHIIADMSSDKVKAEYFPEDSN